MSDFLVDPSTLENAARRLEKAGSELQRLRVASALESICGAVGGGKTDQDSYLIVHGGQEMVRSLATAVTALARVVQTAHDNYERAEAASTTAGFRSLDL